MNVPFATSDPGIVAIAQAMGVVANQVSITITTSYGMVGLHHTEHFTGTYGLHFNETNKGENAVMPLTAQCYVVMPPAKKP